jgi:butyryl-CoA dehydrogenase
MNAFTPSVVVVTGAASGIGRQLSLQAARRGAHVIATDNNRAALEETKNLSVQQGTVLQIATLDVSDATAIENFAAETVRQLSGRKLILVNNAGVALMSGTFQHTSLDDLAWLLNINLWGTIRLTKAFYPYFLQQNEGHIVNLSSVFGLVGIEQQSAYCTSKFAVRGFTETLRMELAGTGIRTTCVHPGGIKTNIVRNAGRRGEATDDTFHQHSIARFEKNAMTTAEEAARQILDAIEKKKDRLVIGRDGWLLDFLARLLPVAYTRIVKRQIEKAFGNPNSQRERR